nr:MAG TPA: hypothetical protein [Caudoviricetes sp.]
MCRHFASKRLALKKRRFDSFHQKVRFFSSKGSNLNKKHTIDGLKKL